MKKICFVTGTRADYGILAPIMKEVAKNPETRLQIIATTMHLSPAYGMTVGEIEEDGFTVDAKIASLVEGGTPVETVKSMAKTQEGLSEALDRLRPDLVVILGDRFEALAAASAAVVFNIPIVHLHGGETTEGAIDDKFRHAITQLATYHFASTPQYVDKIISMGIRAENVFHSGAPGAEVKEVAEEGLPELFFSKTGIYPGEPFILFAFHPVTILEDRGEEELKQTIEALEAFLNQGYKILVTMPNSDPGTLNITDRIMNWASSYPGKVVTVKSLGSKLFHYALETASTIVGNSSAALIEAPSHRLSAVNVGLRQKGRAHGITVIDSPGEREKILKALETALSLEMKVVMMGQPISALNPYYKQDSINFIANRIINF